MLSLSDHSHTAYNQYVYIMRAKKITSPGLLNFCAGLVDSIVTWPYLTLERGRSLTSSSVFHKPRT